MKRLKKEEIIEILRLIWWGLVGIFIIFVLIPRWHEFNDFVNYKLSYYVRNFFEGSLSFAKKAPNRKNEYIDLNYAQSKAMFHKTFTNSYTADDITKTIRSGENLRKFYPDNIDLVHKLAFLTFLQHEYDAAKEYYKEILGAIPRRKMTFEYARTLEDYHALKRTLIEMAALYYEEGSLDKMVFHYKQFLRVTNTKEVYKEIIKQKFTERTVRFEVYSNIAGNGMLSYEKAIEGLEALRLEYPDDAEIAYRLGMLHLDIINVFSHIKEDAIWGNFESAYILLGKALHAADEDDRILIEKNLKQLSKLKEELILKQEMERLEEAKEEEEDS